MSAGTQQNGGTGSPLSSVSNSTHSAFSNSNSSTFRSSKPAQPAPLRSMSSHKQTSNNSNNSLLQSVAEVNGKHGTVTKPSLLNAYSSKHNRGDSAPSTVSPATTSNTATSSSPLSWKAERKLSKEKQRSGKQTAAALIAEQDWRPSTQELQAWLALPSFTVLEYRPDEEVII